MAAGNRVLIKASEITVTGAALGIGLATALKFARERARLAIWDVKQEGVDRSVRQCRELGAQARHDGL